MESSRYPTIFSLTHIQKLIQTYSISKYMPLDLPQKQNKRLDLRKIKIEEIEDSFFRVTQITSLRHQCVLFETRKDYL